MIVLVRHGETEWSRDLRHTGRTDLSLTDLGRQEAVAVRDSLSKREFVRVLCSPLRRARETCDLALGVEPEIVDDLREWDYGDYEGRTTEDIRSEAPGWTIWTGAVPGGESAEEVGARADRVIANLRETADGDVVVFAHGHLLRILAARWIQLSPREGGRFPLQTARLCELGYERDSSAIWSWNLRP